MIQDHWCIKRIDESSLVTNSSVPLMNHVSDFGSPIMIQITPKECNQSVIMIDFRNSKQKDNSKNTEFNVQASSWWYHMTLNTRIWGFLMHLSILSPRGDTPGICGAFDYSEEFLVRIPTVGPQNLLKSDQIYPPLKWVVRSRVSSVQKKQMSQPWAPGS